MIAASVATCFVIALACTLIFPLLPAHALAGMAMFGGAGLYLLTMHFVLNPEARRALFG